MIDIIIIVAYALVALKIVFKAFDWFENRFNVYDQSVVHQKQTSKNETQYQAKSQKNQFTKSSMEIVEKDSNLKQRINQSKKLVLDIKEPKKQVYQLSQQEISLKIYSGLQFDEVYGQIDIKNQMESKSALVSDLKHQISEFPQQAHLQSLKQKNLLLAQRIQELQNECIAYQESNRGMEQKMNKLIDQVQKEKLTSYEKSKTIKMLEQEKNQHQIKIQELKVQHKKQIQHLINEFAQKTQHLQLLIHQKQDRFNQQQNLEKQTLNQKLKESLIKQEGETRRTEFQQQASYSINQKMSSCPLTTQNASLAESAFNSSIEELKNQLLFCKNQLEQAQQSQTKLKEQIENLKSVSKIDSQPQISIIDVINHPEYARIKQKLLKYETISTDSWKVRNAIRSQFTPPPQRGSKDYDSRILERKSIRALPKTSSRIEKKENQSEIFGDCNFLDLQTKKYLLDELKKIKKLPISETKLIFKLDKLALINNPHEFIDNIPNILLLIELTNKKILAAFTQTPFYKSDEINLQKSLKHTSGQNKSLIMDLSKKVSFLNKRSEEAIIYDQNAIVWGKDQLIIKNDEPTLLYSTFGTQDGVYWDGTYALQDFLGSNKGFERINQYEFYRIRIA